MSRRLLAAIAALALAVQTGSALAAFALEPPACCCAKMKMPKGHHCHCPTCAHERQNESGRCALGGCDDAQDNFVPSFPARPFLPLQIEARVLVPHQPLPSVRIATPPPDLPREVPTPPPLD